MSAKPQLFSHLFPFTGNHSNIFTFWGEGRTLLVNVEEGYISFLPYCFEYVSIFATNHSQELSNLLCLICSTCLVYFINE